MGIEVITPPASSGFTTLSRVKALLGIEPSDTDDDAIIEDLIEEAQSVIETITGRTWGKREVKERVPGYGGTEILVDSRPIVTLHGIKFEDQTLDPDTYEIMDANAGIIHRETGFASTHSVDQSVTLQPLAGTQSPKFEVHLTAGYDLATAQTPNFPAILRRAANDFVVSAYTTRDVGSRLTSRKIDDASWTWKETDIHEHLSGLLDPLKAAV